MMVLLIALFALPAKAANGPENLYLAYLKNSVWNYSKFEQNSTDVYTCTHTFGASEKFYIVKGVNAANEPSKSNNTYEVNAYDVSNGYDKTLYLYGESQGAFTCTNEGTYTLKVDFTSSANPTFKFSSTITEPTYNVSIVGFVGQDSWTDTGTNLPYVGNGIYRGEVDLKGSRYFRVIIDGSKFGPNSDTSDKFVAEGTTETIYMNKAEKAFQAPMLNKYFVSVDVYNNTVAVSTSTSTSIDVYLVGDVTGGWDTSKGWKFDTTDGVTYTLTGKDINANSNFKILAGSSWLSSCNQSITVPYNATLTDGSGTDGSKNMRLSSNVTNVKITFNLSNKAFSIESADTPTPTPTASYRLKTSEDNWGKFYPFTDNGDGTYKLTLENPAQGLEMMVQRSSDGQSYFDFCWPSSDDKNYPGGEKTFTMSGDYGTNVTFGAGLTGTYTLTLTPNTTDPKQSTLKISGNAGEVITYKDAYLTGDYNGWNTSDANYKFTTTDGKVYTLTGVNIDNGKLLKVYYDGNYYGHDANKVTGPVSAENDGKGGFNMKLTEELKDATITFDITDAVNWKLTIVNGGAVEHKPYYFVGDMNRWYSKEFEGDESKKGIDPDIFAAEKDKWKFEYVGEVAGQTEKGWYKYVFHKDKVGMSTLVGQFQIIDDSGWSGSQYSNNPKVENYSDASGFARYNCRPITRKMINESTVLTKETSKGMPGIIQQAGSNFHLDCNGVNNAVIYFLPGENPKMFITGQPTDYFIFYSASGKTGGDDAVSIKIVNGKPNTTNYYLPGVEGLKNYTTEDAKSTAPHMNIEAVTPTLIDFSDPNFVNDDNYIKVFGNSGYVGDLTKEKFQEKIINDSQLPNGISLTGRGQVYVAKVPNGFEYAAGRKFAVTFENAFSQSEKKTSSSIVANHLYFFNDNLHVLLNVDEYEAGAEKEDAYVKLYYRVYGYDSEYNTIVVKSDGTTETLYAKNVVIGLTEAGNDTQKNAGWVEYNNYKVPSLTSYTGSDKWHYVTDANNDFLGIDPKYGNFFVQFKIVTGPKSAQGAANGPAKEVGPVYTLYLPEKTLALNQEGFYNFNGQDIYQKFDGGYTTTDVEDVFEDQIVEEGVDAEPIFFNLQGQRVVNPEKGMYIVVKGNKTYKVMIK